MCLVHLPTARTCLCNYLLVYCSGIVLTLTHNHHSQRRLTTRNTLMAHRLTIRNTLWHTDSSLNTLMAHRLITQHTDTHEDAHITTHIKQYAHAPSHYCTYVLIRTPTPCHSTRTYRYTLLLSCCLSRLLYLSNFVGLANSMPRHKKQKNLPRIPLP